MKISVLGDRDIEIKRLDQELDRMNKEHSKLKHNRKVEHAKEVAGLTQRISEHEKTITSEKSVTSKLRSELDKTRKSITTSAPGKKSKTVRGGAELQPAAQGLEMSLLDARLKTVELATKTLQKDMEKLSSSSSKWEQSSNDVSNLSKTISTHQKSLQTMYEKEREKHIVITGVQDGESADDAGSIKEIFDVIGCSGITPTKVSRLGKDIHADNRPRPILVVVNNVTERQDILDHAKALKGAGDKFSSVYLKKDLHPDVRKEWNRLRDVCKKEKAKATNVGAQIFIDYKQGVLKRDNSIIDRYINPFRTVRLADSG